MTPFVKALLAVALVVPLVAYVAGTLSSSGPGAPEQQGTVYLDDAEPAGDTTTGSTTDDRQDDRQSDRQSDRQRPPKRSRDADDSGDSGDDQQQPGPSETDDREARVVTPAPVGRDDDDDDERDDDRDDTDDGGDTDD